MKKSIFFGREINVLYQYENEPSSGYEYSEENIVWKSFGDKKIGGCGRRPGVQIRRATGLIMLYIYCTFLAMLYNTVHRF